MDRPYRITVVCTGNICRSPMAELVLRERLDAAGLGDQAVVDSAGTTAWEEGNPPDPRTVDVLRRHGHDVDGWGHRARVMERSWFSETDLVLAADHGHFSTLRRMAPTPADKAKVHMLRAFDPAVPSEAEQGMDDPWYGDEAGFERTYAEVDGAADGVVDRVRADLASPG